MATIDDLLIGRTSPPDDSGDTNSSTAPDFWIQTLMQSIVQATKSGNTIPIGADYAFYEQTVPEFKLQTQDLRKDISYLIERISKFFQNGEGPSDSNGNGKKGKFGSGEHISDEIVERIPEYSEVQALIEGLLERADLCLDAVKRAADGKSLTPVGIKTKFDKTNSNSNGVDSVETIPKPQLSFFHLIDNSRQTPFRPKISKKPHSKVPLLLREQAVSAGLKKVRNRALERTTDEDDMDEPDEEDAELANDSSRSHADGPTTYFSHPYESELQNLSYPEWQMADASYSSSSHGKAAVAELARLTNDTKHPFEYISTLHALEHAVEEMGAFTEIAVDVEHHSIRTFQGITCLIQISTRAKDYIVDVLAIQAVPSSAAQPLNGVSNLQILNEIFCDPNIVKVFHGCARDILWLQRDCGIYIVNCFDTYQAGVELKLPSLSLAYLLMNYCHVSAQKQYQQADWRQRPLSKELIKYARDDTHYLLYIYDCLRRDIWKTVGREGYCAGTFPLSYCIYSKTGHCSTSLSLLENDRHMLTLSLLFLHIYLIFLYSTTCSALTGKGHMPFSLREVAVPASGLSRSAA